MKYYKAPLEIERILLYIKYKRMFDTGGTYSWKTKNTLHLLLNYLKETGIAQKRSIISLSDSWKDDLQFLSADNLGRSSLSGYSSFFSNFLNSS